MRLAEPEQAQLRPPAATPSPEWPDDADLLDMMGDLDDLAQSRRAGTWERAELQAEWRAAFFEAKRRGLIE